MAALRKPTTEKPSVNDSRRVEEEEIRRYFDLVDDGELARLAAMMSPKTEAFDARALIAQATALQAEAAAEFIRRREKMVESMSIGTLRDIARRLGVGELGFLRVIDEEALPDHPIQGPVLRRLATLMRDLPPPQDFADLFLAENPTEALKRASNRTSLRRPLPDATLEELLRFAANIPEDKASWDILEGAFIDFLRMWFQDRLDLAELIDGGPDLGTKKSKDASVMDRIERLQQNRTRFYESFKPGHEFHPDIVELAHRAYTECWEGGNLGPQWLRRFAWLADEFPPFWQRFGDAYCEIHQARVKAADEVEAKIRSEQNKKSAKARKSGETGLQGREAKKWRKITASFIEFLKDHFDGSSTADLDDSVGVFVNSQFSRSTLEFQEKVLSFLHALCRATTSGVDARTVLDTLQGTLAAKIEGLSPALRQKHLNKLLPNQRNQYLKTGTIPPAWVQFKSLTEASVRACLDDLKQILVEPSAKKTKK